MRNNKYTKNFIGKKVKDEEIKGPADTAMALWREAEKRLKAWHEESKIGWFGGLTAGRHNQWFNQAVSGTPATPIWNQSLTIQPNQVTVQPNQWNWQQQQLNFKFNQTAQFDFNLQQPETRFFIKNLTDDGAFFPCPLTP